MIFHAASRLGRRVAVVGSTDLTHYGNNYDFSPMGGGEKALHWVKEVNDRRFIDCLLSMDAAEALERAIKERSACSVGGALAAMGFARAGGIAAGKLVDYRTSSDIVPADSFVGYAGVLYA
jgi:AmmeMemoRadiSam system protein B